MLGLKDALVTAAVALPTGASAVLSPSIDLGLGTKDETAQFMEWELDVPALTVTQLPNTDTMTYDIVISANSNLSGSTNVYPGILVQTGAGGVGAAATSVRFRLPLSPPATGGEVPASKRYLGFRATNSEANDASAASATLNGIF